MTSVLNCKELLKKTYPWLVLSLIVGFGLGYFLAKNTTNASTNVVDTGEASLDILRLNNSDDKFIAPLLASDISEKISFRELSPMKDKINSLISNLKASNKLDDMSLYFRRLNNGEWVAINESAEFAPASLMKVPIMIAYFKLAESDPSILDKQLTYDGSEDKNLSEYTKPAQSIQKGQTYSVNELIEYMVIYSDNNALNLLGQNIDQSSLQEVYMDLGIKIPDPTTEKPDYFTVKDYSLLVRILFNATYLNKTLSEKALEIMSRSDFKNGIVAGVPSDVQVAHKFGERIFVDPHGILFNSYELHDCGIVYYPQNPYLLCIMTKGSQGNNYSDLEESIKQVSQLVYSEAKNGYK